MAIDLQKLEQKFNALFEDENIVAEFEQWLEARNVKPKLQQCNVSGSLPTLEQSKKAMLRRKTKFVDNMGKFSSRKNAYKQGWQDCYNWIMSQCNDR